jgi:hypothetical protein
LEQFRKLLTVALLAGTIAGLLLFTPLPVRLLGLLAFTVPDAVGAPVPSGESNVPAELIHRFVISSILTAGILRIALGSIGALFYQRSGYLYQRSGYLYQRSGYQGFSEPSIRFVRLRCKREDAVQFASYL